MRLKLRALWLLVIALVAGAVLMVMASQAAPASLTTPSDQSEPQQPPRPPGPPGGRGGPGGPEQVERLVMALDLTSDQLSQIKALGEQERSDSQAYHDQVKQVRDSLLAMMQTGTFDESAVRTLAAAEAKAQIELTVIRVRTQIAVYQLLTADQRAKLIELLKTPPPPGPPR